MCIRDSSKDVWYCNRRYQGSNNCSTPILAEGDLIRYYLQALSEILADKDRYISACKAQMDEANALEKIRFKRDVYKRQIEIILSHILPQSNFPFKSKYFNL